jgi:hypothetical protein
LITSEPMFRIVEAVKAFMASFKRANFHTLQTELSNDRFKTVLSRAHVKYKVTKDSSGIPYATIEV